MENDYDEFKMWKVLCEAHKLQCKYCYVMEKAVKKVYKNFKPEVCLIIIMLHMKYKRLRNFHFKSRVLSMCPMGFPQGP